jgi:hypothetical protein
MLASVSVGVDAQPLLRDRRAQRVATQPLEPFALAGSDDDPRVQVEAADVRVTRTDGDRPHLLRRAAVAGNAGARPWAERDDALHRRRGKAGERRRFLCPRVGRRSPPTSPSGLAAPAAARFAAPQRPPPPPHRHA